MIWVRSWTKLRIFSLGVFGPFGFLLPRKWLHFLYVGREFRGRVSVWMTSNTISVMLLWLLHLKYVSLTAPPLELFVFVFYYFLGIGPLVISLAGERGETGRRILSLCMYCEIEGSKTKTRCKISLPNDGKDGEIYPALEENWRTWTSALGHRYLMALNDNDSLQ